MICQAMLALGSNTPAAAASSPHDPLFASDEPLAITLTGPFKKLDKKRDKAADYAPGRCRTRVMKDLSISRQTTGPEVISGSKRKTAATHSCGWN